jgi:hypothetical protein
METHLTTCEACRDELRELRIVSNLLRADPAPEFTSAERFVSQLTLNLPRRLLHERPPKPGSLAWWLVPAGLLGAWFFLKTVFTLTDMVTAANVTGLLGHTASWLGGGQETIWFSVATSLFGGLPSGAQSTLSMLNNWSVIGMNLLSGFIWQAAIVLLYWIWLSIWWLRSSQRSMKMHNAS